MTFKEKVQKLIGVHNICNFTETPEKYIFGVLCDVMPFSLLLELGKQQNIKKVEYKNYTIIAYKGDNYKN